MSADNECGHYCNVEDGQYYTIAVKQRFAPVSSPVVAYIVQLHNGIYSETAVRYLQRVKERIENKPVILVGHQFAGSALATFNATVRQLKVKLLFSLKYTILSFTSIKHLKYSYMYCFIAHRYISHFFFLKVALIIHGHYHCDQQHDRDHCDFRDNQPSLLLDRFGADFTNVHGAVIPRVTSNAAFHNIFWSVTLDPEQGSVKVIPNKYKLQTLVYLKYQLF